MSFFVDTNVIVYAASGSALAEPCRAILGHAVQSGAGRTSTAVLEEVWHLELRGRPGDIDGLAAATYDLLTPLLDVTDAIVAEAFALDAPGLGANDRIRVATCRQADIETIVTVDAGFDGVRGLKRIDPRDQAAVERLLRS